MHFYDGSRIGIAPGSNMVVYSHSAQSNAETFNTKEALPDEVRQKLALVPKAVEQLYLCNRDAPPAKPAMLR